MVVARAPLKTPLPLRRLLLIFVMLSGLMGELTLQSMARPHEMPRNEISRILGFDIASGGCSLMQQSSHHDRYHHHGHMQHGCILCTLLTLTAVVLSDSVLPGFNICQVSLRQKTPQMTRAPPIPFYVRPFGQGPPQFS